MFSPVEIAKGIVETFDGGAIELFRRYLANHSRVEKWMIAADFALHDPQRPMDCFAFSILPYDDWPHGIEAEISAALPRDLKKSKNLSPEAMAWLRDTRRFHFAFTFGKTREIFDNGPRSDSLRIAREHIDLTVTALSSPEHVDALRRFKTLRQKALANNFNVSLLADIWTLATLFATLTILIGREQTCAIVGWFPDRDNMTNFCEGIWHDYAFWNTRALCEGFEVDMSKTQIGVGVPDRSGANEDMWFDYLIRPADWFAGTIAAWDRDNNLVPGEHSKYISMLEEVMVEAENAVIIHGDIQNQRAQFVRVTVGRSQPQITPQSE